MNFFALFTKTINNIPQVDFLSAEFGPVTGGDGDNGIYLSIFGKNFGSSPSVKIGGVSVAVITLVGKSRNGLYEKVVVQPGGLVSGGNVVVTNSKGSSIQSHFFTPCAGEITEWSEGDGNADVMQMSINAMDSGDVKIIRGGVYGASGIQTFTTCEGTFVKPIAIMGYPGETAKFSAHAKRLNSAVGFVDYSNFLIDGQDLDGTLFNAGSTPNISIRDCECTGQNGHGGGSGAVHDSDGGNYRVLGNWVHDVGSTDPDFGTAKLYHGIYISGSSSNVEVAFNLVEDVFGGRGCQYYDNSDTKTDGHVHHNIIRRTRANCLNFAKGCTTGFSAHDNIFEHNAATYNTVNISNSAMVLSFLNNDCSSDTETEEVYRLDAYESCEFSGNKTRGALFLVQNGGAPDPSPAVGNTWIGKDTPPLWG